MILLAAVGYVVKMGGNFDDIFEISRRIATHPSLDAPINTFGYKAYENNFLGLRGQARTGFVAVKNASLRLKKQSLRKTLCSIVGQIDDSVLLKRAKSFDNYLDFKKLISTVDADDLSAVKDLTDTCIQNNISIGGAADLLCATVMVDKLKDLFYLP